MRKTVLTWPKIPKLVPKAGSEVCEDSWFLQLISVRRVTEFAWPDCSQ